MKNCNTWAKYERPGTSATANMCNGGWYKGDYFEPCDARDVCIDATRRSLPMYGQSTQMTHPARPFGSGSQITAQTPNIDDYRKKLNEFLPSWGPMSTTQPRSGGTQRPNVPLPTPMQISAPLPYPVQPPPEWPGAMQTTYAGPTPVLSGGVTPTFLPQQGESIGGRLLKNVVQGMVGSTGWHVFDYSRTVDFFGAPKS